MKKLAFVTLFKFCLREAGAVLKWYVATSEHHCRLKVCCYVMKKYKNSLFVIDYNCTIYYCSMCCTQDTHLLLGLNGRAGRQIQYFVKIMKCTQLEGWDWKQRVFFLRAKMCNYFLYLWLWTVDWIEKWWVAAVVLINKPKHVCKWCTENFK